VKRKISPLRKRGRRNNMPTEKEQLRRTVEDLKQVPYNEWRYFNNQTATGFTYMPSLMRVSVYHEVAPLGNRFEMEIEDICEEDKKTYKGDAVRSLYEYLESQRARNLPVSTSATEEKSTEESLLEKLSKELGRK